MSNEDRDKPGWALDLGRSIGVIGIVIGIVALFITDTSGGNRLATLGGTLVAGAAALLFIEALSVQRKELSLTREELQQTRLEMQAQKKEFEKQNKIAEWDAMYKHLQVLLERDGRENYEGLKDIYMKCFEKYELEENIFYESPKGNIVVNVEDSAYWKCIQMFWGKYQKHPDSTYNDLGYIQREMDLNSNYPHFINFTHNNLTLSIHFQNYLLNSVLLIGLLRRMKTFAESNEMSNYYTNLDVYNMFTSVKFEITFHYLVFYRRNFELAQYVSDEIIKGRNMLIKPSKEVNDKFFKGNKTGTYGVLEEGLKAFY